MTKLSFLFSLRENLSSLPSEEAEEHLRFYSEMIEDRMEEGLTEEEAVSEVGPVDDIAAQILSEIGIPVEQNMPKPKKQRSTWAVVLLILGSPLWLSVLIAAFAVVFAMFAALWAVIVSFWSVFAAFAGSAAGLFVTGTMAALNGNLPYGLSIIGAGLILGGLSVFLFYGCKAATKGSVRLTKRTCRLIFRKKEEA